MIAEGTRELTEKLKASSVEPECLGSYAVCGCSCAHAVLHDNKAGRASGLVSGVGGPLLCAARENLLCGHEELEAMPCQWVCQ